MAIASSIEKGAESCGRLDNTMAKEMAADLDDIKTTMTEWLGSCRHDEESISAKKRSRERVLV